MCVCVCVCERERERERESPDKGTVRSVFEDIFKLGMMMKTDLFLQCYAKNDKVYRQMNSKQMYYQ